MTAPDHARILATLEAIAERLRTAEDRGRECARRHGRSGADIMPFVLGTLGACAEDAHRDLVRVIAELRVAPL